MLKIKDNVDLKELEKYGFIFMDYDDLWYSYYYNPEENIKINYSDRKLDFYLCGMTESSINILYDLIKDGLVEKVKNNNLNRED